MRLRDAAQVAVQSELLAALKTLRCGPAFGSGKFDFWVLGQGSRVPVRKSERLGSCSAGDVRT